MRYWNTGSCREVKPRSSWGVSEVELARQFGVHRHTVDRVLRRVGVVKRPGVRMVGSLLEKAKELYAQGLSVAAVGKKLGLSASTVHSAFTREGVRMRPRGRQA